MMAEADALVDHLFPSREAEIRRWSALRWLRESEMWRYDLIHVIGWPTFWGLWMAARLRRRPVILHWIGSDVMAFTARPVAGRVAGRILRVLVPQHLAVAAHLVDELQTLGIRASEHLHGVDTPYAGPIRPLPECPVALVYLTRQRFEFYGGRLMLDLASQDPGVQWLVVGCDAEGWPARPNVRYLGCVADVGPLYDEASVLVRITAHDGSPNMIREALAHGRHVVWNRPMSFCALAMTPDQVLPVVRRLSRSGPNLQGAAWVRAEYSVERQRQRLDSLYKSTVAGHAKGPAGASR